MAASAAELQKVADKLSFCGDKLSYIEARLDASECRVSDLERHIGQYLAEFDLSRGDEGILENWLLESKLSYLKAQLLLGLPEGQAHSAWHLLLDCFQWRFLAQSRADVLMAKHKLFYEPESLSTKAALESALWAQHLTEENLGLAAWTENVLSKSETKAFKMPDSIYLRTQIQMAKLSKLKSLTMHQRCEAQVAELHTKWPEVGAKIENMVLKFKAEKCEVTDSELFKCIADDMCKSLD